jgi:uncharacterized protein (TIGR02118 family)
LLQHKPEHSVEQFRHHWRNVHGPLAAVLHGVRRYVQSHFSPDDALTNGFARGLGIDGLAAISFDNEEDRSICYASHQEEICDVDSLLFIGATARYVTEVETRSSASGASTGHKAVLLMTPSAPEMAARIDEAVSTAGVSELIRHRITAPGAVPTQARRQIVLPLQTILELTASDRASLEAGIAALAEGLAEGDVAVFAATAHRIV